MMVFADIRDVGHEEEREVKDDSKGFSLSNCKGEVVINENGEGYGKNRYRERIRSFHLDIFL